MSSTAARDDVIRKFARDRRLAHSVLFEHRHANASPEFHGEIIDAFHDTARPKVVAEAFRGAAKSTLAEEVITLRGSFREFRNALIVGDSEPRAIERLASVKHEFESNDYLAELFGEQRGSTWQETKIQLTSGTVIQALGRGQSLRGVKHLDWRPDFVLIDDIEDDETVASPMQRRKTMRWLYKALFPALDPNAMVRFIGNRLDEEAAIVQVSKDPAWFHLRFPVVYFDQAGVRCATWPERFPLEKIDEVKAEFVRQGLLNDFEQEYMCQAGAAEEQTFRSEMMRVEPRVRTWEATWAMFDPARTTNATSARTGFAAWSWAGPQLVVWGSWGRLLKPNEIIDALFECDDRFRPIALGVEEDGLNEWLLQPLRAEIAKRSHALPLRPVSAPRDKSKKQFIRGLQPFFNAREVVFAEEQPDLREQLLSHPTGSNDIANALAYALRLRPGAPIYEDFTSANIAEGLTQHSHRPLYLVMNATPSYTTAALVQHVDGLRVLADFVEEGDPPTAARAIVTNAQLEAGTTALKLIGPPVHFDRFNNVGLKQALARIPLELDRGADPNAGRAELRSMLQRQIRGQPAVVVAYRARWVLNGFSGGYARDFGKDAQLNDVAKEGAYRTLMEGLESFVGLLKVGADADGSNQRHYAYTADGRRYTSAHARR